MLEFMQVDLNMQDKMMKSISKIYTYCDLIVF